MQAKPSQAKPYRPVSVFFGIVLIFAAFMKIISSSQPVSSFVTALIPSWASDLLLAGELLFGIHLIVGQFRYLTWVLSLFLLGLFLLHSLSLAATNSTSCGCMGAVKIAPVLTALFDVFMIGALIRCRPDWDGWPVVNPVRSPVAKAVMVMSSLLVVVAIASTMKYGSVSNALNVLNGRRVMVTPYQVSLFNVDPQSNYNLQVQVANFGDEPIDVHLFHARCYCATATNLPVSVSQKQTGIVQLTFRSPGHAQSFRRTCVLSTSAGDLEFDIVGTTKFPSSHPQETRP